MAEEFAGVRDGRSADEISIELSSRRTGMSFQRTRMSADRTLMSVIRTSLSLIGFGFTIFQVFQKLYDAQVLHSSQAARRFGEALVLIGITVLLSGIAYHCVFMMDLRKQRDAMKAQGLVHAESRFPPSFTLLVAFLLLLLGLFVIASMAFEVGPFG